ncbi:hypothetical protein SORBI_3009G128200 [Sorghum bicolor]|uniref:Uncharacterized protein n=1 Tax=Sorghum bicolor TaxID=4558 RepID=A0A1B6P8B4_SORBI|nr:hypothetical protein SORBI_3009G128200 [Sorghum bicolor]
MSTSLRLQSCTPRLFFFSRKDQPVDSLVVINRFLGHATEATASPRVLGFSMRACAPRPRARVLGFSIRACNAALCVRPDTRINKPRGWSASTCHFHSAQRSKTTSGRGRATLPGSNNSFVMINDN